MSRFIEISKGLHINADMIMEIVEEENAISYKMADGTYHRTMKYQLKSLIGATTLRTIIPVAGFFYKQLDENGNEEMKPLHFIGITNIGEIRAVDAGDYEPLYIDECSGFMGVFKGDEDLLWEKRGD